ncbi:hypothetical protein ACW4FQ_25115, partial [Escherichia coli]
DFQSHGRLLKRAKVSGRLARGVVWRPVAADSSRRLVMAALLAQPANGLNRIEQILSSVIAELSWIGVGAASAAIIADKSAPT